LTRGYIDDSIQADYKIQNERENNASNIRNMVDMFYPFYRLGDYRVNVVEAKFL